MKTHVKMTEDWSPLPHHPREGDVLKIIDCDYDDDGYIYGYKTTCSAGVEYFVFPDECEEVDA